jgi:hypothetical protein
MRWAFGLAVLLAATPAHAQQQGVDGRLIGGIALVAVAAGAAAAGIYGSVRVDDINGDDGFQSYRARVRLGDDACDLADAGAEAGPPAATAAEVVDMCKEGEALSILQAVMYPLAIASGGAAAYLLATSPTAGGDSNAWRLVPRVGRESGALEVSLSF